MRSGLIYLGDVSSRTGDLSVTGSISSSTVGTAYGSGDCLVNFTFNDNGYVPVISITI
jgi:hypothetical protein